MIDVFVSYAPDDSLWAERLAERLRDRLLDVYSAEWNLLPGDLVKHHLEAAFRESRCGIAVIGSTSQRSPQARDEYAALYEESERRGLRFIPVLVGDATLPPFASTRVWLDFRGVSESEYDAKVDQLAAAIGGQATAPEPAAIVVCYEAADQEYGRRLVDQLSDVALPAWSVRHLRPGDEHFPIIRQRLRDAIAIVILMTPQSQDSADITRMILEGQVHRRPFVPILLHGRRNYHLAHTWYLDARDGQLPKPRDLAILHQLHDAHRSATPVDPVTVLPTPPTRTRVPAARVPSVTSLDRLNRYLGDQETAHADLLTTTLLLEAADRLEDGWLGHTHGQTLPLDLLSAVDEVWARHTHGRQGFTAQRGLAEIGGERHADFRRLSVAYGWRRSDSDDVPPYPGFTDRAGPGGRAAFFPTLRNPQNEHFQYWYQQWRLTVTAVHLRLREGERS